MEGVGRSSNFAVEFPFVTLLCDGGETKPPHIVSCIAFASGGRRNSFACLFQFTFSILSSKRDADMFTVLPFGGGIRRGCLNVYIFVLCLVWLFA